MLSGSSLYRKYVIVIVALVSSALLVSGAVQLYFSYQESQAALIRIQQEQARSAAVRIEEFVRGIVHHDASRLKQVLYNLLSNANKLTPEGGRASDLDSERIAARVGGRPHALADEHLAAGARQRGGHLRDVLVADPRASPALPPTRRGRRRPRSRPRRCRSGTAPRPCRGPGRRRCGGSPPPARTGSPAAARPRSRWHPRSRRDRA